MTTGALLAALSLLPEMHRRPPRVWLLVTGATLLLAALASPAALRPVKRAWLFAGFLMGLAVNPIVLAVLFYLVITPCGLLLRLCGADPLQLRRHHRASFWRERSGPPSTMKEQF